MAKHLEKGIEPGAFSRRENDFRRDGCFWLDMHRPEARKRGEKIKVKK